MFEDAASFNQPLNKWNVQYVTDMSYMFSGAISFNQALNNWNVSNVEYMYSMLERANFFRPEHAPWYEHEQWRSDVPWYEHAYSDSDDY